MTYNVLQILSFSNIERNAQIAMLLLIASISSMFIFTFIPTFQYCHTLHESFEFQTPSQRGCYSKHVYDTYCYRTLINTLMSLIKWFIFYFAISVFVVYRNKRLFTARTQVLDLCVQWIMNNEWWYIPDAFQHCSDDITTVEYGKSH